RRRRRVSPVVDRRDACIHVEAAPEVERDSEITSPEREAKATVLAERTSALFERMHGERARSREPELVSGQLVELQERIAVSRSSVTESGAFDERSRAPDQLPRGQRELGGHEVADCFHASRRPG